MSHRSSGSRSWSRKVRNDPPVPGARDGPARSSASPPGPTPPSFWRPILAQIAEHVAGAGPLPEPVQVRPGRAHLPALGLDHRLGRARHQGAEQRQVRASGTASSSSPGCSGLLLVCAIPIYPLGLTAAAAGVLRPAPDVIYVRNQTVPDDQKVLTPYHLGEVVNGLMCKLGMQAAVQQGRHDGATAPGRRSRSSARARGGQGRPQPGAPGRGVAVVHGGQGAGLRRGPPPGDRHPPRADHRAALGPLPDRRHPARRRAVRPAHRRRRDQRLQGPLGDGHLGEAEAAGRLVRRQARRPATSTSASRPRARRPARSWSCESSTTRPGSPSSKTWACGPSWSSRSAAWSPSRTACSSAAARPGRASRPRSTPPPRDRPLPEEHHHRRGPDRIPHGQHHPDGGQHQGRADLRHAACGRSCGKTPT